MQYDTIRPSIKSGDLLAWSHRSWQTWYDFKVQAVRFFTQSEYAHVAVAYIMGERVWVLESVTPVVRMVPLRNLLPCYIIPLNADWTTKTEEFALSLVGNGKYSQLEAMKAYFGHNHDANAWECAEYVKAVLEECGIKLPGKAVPSSVVQDALERNTSMTYLEILPPDQPPA